MNKIVVMTALAAGLLVSAAAIAAPRAVAPSGAVTLVRAGGGGNGHFGNIGAATMDPEEPICEPKGHLGKLSCRPGESRGLA